MHALLLTLALSACSQPEKNASAAPAANVPPVTGTTANNTPAPTQAVPEDAQLTTRHAENIDARTLPEDVQGYILRHRMCKHLGAANAQNPVCVNASADAWKALIRKYQGKDDITGVLLAEKPDGIKGMEGLQPAAPSPIPDSKP